MSLTWKKQSLEECYTATKKRWTKPSLYAHYMPYDTVPCTYHESQSGKCFHNLACIFISNQHAPISYPFQTAKYNSYLCLETFCFKIAQMQNLQHWSEATRCQFASNPAGLGDQHSWIIIILLLERKELCFYRNNHHAVWTESNHTSRWMEKKREGGWERGQSLSANPTLPMKWKQLVHFHHSLGLDK